MAASAGFNAAILPGDLGFGSGGVSVAFLVGAFVKSITTAGAVTLQQADGTEATINISTGATVTATTSDASGGSEGDLHFKLTGTQVTNVSVRGATSWTTYTLPSGSSSNSGGSITVSEDDASGGNDGDLHIQVDDNDVIESIWHKASDTWTEYTLPGDGHTTHAYADLTGKPDLSRIPTAPTANTDRGKVWKVASDSDTPGWHPDTDTQVTSLAWGSITGKPTFFSGSYADLTNKPDLSNLHSTHSYSDLTNKPDLSALHSTHSYFSGAWADITGKPTLFSGSYADLTNKPDLSRIPSAPATADRNKVWKLASDSNTPGWRDEDSVAWADVTGKPTLFSGSYSDLTNKPDLSSLHSTHSYFSGAWGDITGKPTFFSGSYADLTNKPDLSSLHSAHSYNDLTNKPDLSALHTTHSYFSGAWGDITGKPTFFSGAYDDLTGAPDLTALPRIPGTTLAGHKVWKTDGSGTPGWRDDAEGDANKPRVYTFDNVLKTTAAAINDGHDPVTDPGLRYMTRNFGYPHYLTYAHDGSILVITQNNQLAGTSNILTVDARSLVVLQEFVGPAVDDDTVDRYNGNSAVWDEERERLYYPYRNTKVLVYDITEAGQITANTAVEGTATNPSGSHANTCASNGDYVVTGDGLYLRFYDITDTGLVYRNEVTFARPANSPTAEIHAMTFIGKNRLAFTFSRSTTVLIVVDITFDSGTSTYSTTEVFNKTAAQVGRTARGSITDDIITLGNWLLLPQEHSTPEGYNPILVSLTSPYEVKRVLIPPSIIPHLPSRNSWCAATDGRYMYTVLNVDQDGIVDEDVTYVLRIDPDTLEIASAEIPLANVNELAYFGGVWAFTTFAAANLEVGTYTSLEYTPWPNKVGETVDHALAVARGTLVFHTPPDVFEGAGRAAAEAARDTYFNASAGVQAQVSVPGSVGSLVLWLPTSVLTDSTDSASAPVDLTGILANAHGLYLTIDDANHDRYTDDGFDLNVRVDATPTLGELATYWATIGGTSEYRGGAVAATTIPSTATSGSVVGYFAGGTAATTAEGDIYDFQVNRTLSIILRDTTNNLDHVQTYAPGQTGAHDASQWIEHGTGSEPIKWAWLPEMPAAGSRDGKVPKFLHDAVQWLDDADTDVETTTDTGFTIAAVPSSTTKRRVTLPAGRTLADYNRITLDVELRDDTSYFGGMPTAIGGNVPIVLPIPELVAFTSATMNFLVPWRGAGVVAIQVEPTNISGTSTYFDVSYLQVDADPAVNPGNDNWDINGAAGVRLT